MASQKDFSVKARPTWCPSCWNWSVWGALKNALVELTLEPHKVLIVYGIGCSGNMTNFVNTYGFHGLHGRPIPIAIGAKLANHKLAVIVVAGDGDTYGEGMNHFLQAARGNHDITLIVHNNQNYGLTTGQKSPTSERGYKSKSSPAGVRDTPVNPISLALASGAGFVSRGYAVDPLGVQKLIVEAVKFKGFSLIDVLQPCITFNKLNTSQWFKERVYDLEESSHDSLDYKKALLRSLEWGEKIPVGIFYKKEKPTYKDYLPQIKDKALVEQDLKDIDIFPLFEEFI